MNTLTPDAPPWLVLKRRGQDGINMVDLMMWLVIAALLLAAAIQGIGYYQKAAYLYQIQSDLEGVGTIANGVAANEDGVITKEVVEKALLEAKRSAEVVTTVELASDGKTPFIRGTHPAVLDKDGLYLFDACSDVYKIGVNVVPKGGTVALEACGISAAAPGGGSGTTTPPAGGVTPTADDIDGDTIPNASDPDIDGDGTPNAEDTTPNGATPPAGGGGTTEPPATGGGGGTTTPPATTVGNAIGRSSTLQIAGFGSQWTNDLAENTGEYSIKPTDSVLQGALAAEPIYMFSKNVGSYHACAVGTLERDLYCWGDGGRGVLGNGSTDDAPLPVEVTALSDKTISEVVTGGYGTCAIADNKLYCWGDYFLAGTSDYALTPTEVGASVLAGKTLTSLVAGNQFGCVLADGQPYCWGKYDSGELGNGDSGQYPDGRWKFSTTPVPVVTTAFGGKTITALGAQNSGACAIAEGSLYCWGDNEYGQLGDNKTTDSNVPVAVTGGLAGKTVTQVSGTYSDMCATTTESILYCWGGNWGVASTPTAKFTTGAFAGKAVTSFGFGDGHTCAVASNQVYCWGNAEGWGEDYASFATPQLVDNGLFTGKKVLNVWSTAAANFVNYEK